MMLKAEIERLNGLLRIKDEEISSWDLRYRELEVINIKEINLFFHRDQTLV